MPTEYVHEVLASDASDMEKAERIAEILRKNPSMWPMVMAGHIVSIHRLTDLLDNLTKTLTRVLK